MDVKGIAWVGHVYQKFEAMFLEVEEIMYEDTVKYVENQVQNVGASVKKFYSDMMDDLNPPSLLSDAKVDASDLPDKQYSNVVICKKPSKGMEIRIGCTGKSSEKIKVAADEETKASVKKPFIDSCSRWGDGSLSQQIDASFEGSLEKRVHQAENPLGKASIQLDETTLSIESANDEIENGKNVTRCVPSCGHSMTQPDGVKDRLIAEVASPLNEVDEVFVSHPGRSDWWDLHEIESDADLEPEKRSVLKLDSTKLDESCIVISKGDDLLSASHEETKNRHYRRKIKEVFSSKKRMTRKQEYEHLVGLYKSNPAQAESLMGGVRVETQNLGENDWELL